MDSKSKDKDGLGVSSPQPGSATSDREPSTPADLVVEPADGGAEQVKFQAEFSQNLKETEEALLQVVGDSLSEVEARSWQRARTIVEQFRPVPWFIWRLSHFVLGTPGQTKEVSEGMVFGLRRLLFAAASDPVLGVGEKVNSVRKALQVIPADAVAAVAVMHAVNRRLSSKGHDRLWRPIVDDAILRARLGVEIGGGLDFFGAGRGMLAGYAGRCGLAILLASGAGDTAKAARCLELLAGGESIRDVGFKVYECDPLQVSAMTLSAAGCGRDAAFGTVAFSLRESAPAETFVDNDEQLRWCAAFTAAEALRTGKLELMTPGLWAALGLTEESEQSELRETCKKIGRRGHGWPWL